MTKNMAISQIFYRFTLGLSSCCKPSDPERLRMLGEFRNRLSDRGDFRACSMLELDLIRRMDDPGRVRRDERESGNDSRPCHAEKD